MTPPQVQTRPYSGHVGPASCPSSQTIVELAFLGLQILHIKARIPETNWNRLQKRASRPSSRDLQFDTLFGMRWE